ncbi:protein NATD1 [Schistocerca nitens]|uniref:protein NATD1 n=1 Tax=Schistocerca nitens TaxID=7011 RepID=UPI0021189D6D|nr:protein NATD1 [Schistocerca nitens]
MLRRSARILARTAKPNASTTAIMQFSTDALEVSHDKSVKEFFITLGKERAFLQYDEDACGVVDLLHTEVPSIFQGKGVGRILAKAAFDYVHNNELKMKLTCEYLQKAIGSFPEYKKIVVN